MTNSIWDDPYDLEKLANNYQRISYELSENPIEIEIEEVITEQLEHFNTPRIFTPSLQYQRNTFVRDILKAHKTETQEALSKMAVLGCGSLSLERFLLHILANLGFGRVISVDIDEQELAKGLKLMKIAQQNNKDIICGSNEDPVLIEIYRGKVISSQRLDGLLSNYISGNILNYDRRLFNVNCVCSTEVFVRFTYLDGATQFAIFKKKELDTNTEQKMVEISCFKKVGHSIALYGLYALLRDKAIMAFTTWLNNNSLRKEDCVDCYRGYRQIDSVTGIYNDQCDAH
uniref:Small RNA 2'-O-methyltransferase n=1 Tax=Heterorhabditis bacteriophora TaxID=37862 RepID=A0A1I7WSW0_HETBA